jgi:hypothetical protein
MLSVKLYTLLAFLIFQSQVNCGLFESEDEYKELLEIETKFIGEFEKFVEAERKNLEFLERFEIQQKNSNEQKLIEI